MASNETGSAARWWPFWVSTRWGLVPCRDQAAAAIVRRALGGHVLQTATAGRGVGR